MPGPAPVTLNPIPTTAAWDGSRFTVSYIGRVSNPARDTTYNLDIGHILYSSFGDITGDGWPEIIIAGWTFRPAAGGQMNAPGTALPMPINVISTSGSGAAMISSAQLFGTATTAGLSNIRIADFNRDGRNDVYFIGHNEAPFTVVPSTLYTWTPGGFTPQSGSFLTTSHEAFNGDFNGDGLMDVVTSAYHTRGPLPTIWTTGNSHGNTFYQTSDARPAILLNLGDGQGGFRTYPIAFDRPNADLAGSNAWQFGNWAGGSASAFADFDNDGRSEIVVSDLYVRGSNDFSFTYLISNIQFEANSAYGSISRLPAPYFDRDNTYAGATSAFGANKSHDVQVLVFDYNNDGLLDILVNSMIWNPGTENGGQDYSITQILRNDGGLRFTDVTDGVFFNAYMGKQDPGHDSILVDVNGDGFLDLVSTAEPDYVGGQTRPNSQSNEVFINTGDGKFVSAMWNQFGALTDAVNSALVAQGVGRAGFMGTGHTFFPYVRPDGALAFITYENNPRPDGTFDRYFFNVVPDRAMSTGPGGINAATVGAAGFNEAYYLTTYASVASAVQAGQYADGLSHYLAVGRASGFNGFAKNAQVQGTAGNDVITLREGNEKAFGLAGDDVLQGGLGDDVLDGGAGFDTADYTTSSAGVTIDLGLITAQNSGGAGRDTLIAIEGVRGSAFADILTGNAVANVLTGGGGNDTLRGNGGSDVIDGGAGIDTAVYAGLSRGYSGISQTRVAGGREGGADTLSGIERVRFLDGTISYESGQAVWIQDEATIAVARLYQVCLGRAPDIAGLEHYRSAVDQGYDLMHFTRAMIESPEFISRFGTLTNQQFVEQVYRFVLGREGDAGGVTTYVASLSQGYSRADIVLVFAESPENKLRYQTTWETVVQRLEDGRYPAGAADENDLSKDDGRLVLPGLDDDGFLTLSGSQDHIMIAWDDGSLSDPVTKDLGLVIPVALDRSWAQEAPEDYGVDQGQRVEWHIA